MADIPQEVREAAKWRHGPTCGSHAFADRACTCGAEAEFHAMFLAGKRAGMERAAEIVDGSYRMWGEPRCCAAKDIAKEIRSEADGHG